MADSIETIMKTIAKWEKQSGGDHRLRHVFGALREARYAASRVSADSNYDSPGRQEAAAVAGKAHIPEPESARNPNVPETSDGSGAADGNAGAVT